MEQREVKEIKQEKGRITSTKIIVSTPLIKGSDNENKLGIKGITKTITKDTKLADILEKYPETIMIFINHGLGCVSCSSSSHDTIESGCKIHGINPEQFLAELNEFVKSKSN